MAKKFFESFIDKILDFPFWVKEIIYVKIREDFERAFVSEEDLQSPSEESYQVFKPQLTFIGEKELETRENKEEENLYRFLEIANDGCSIAEITLRNFWTLEQTAKIHVYAMQKEYIKQSSSAKITATALYLSGKIKMGDYLKRIGKITIDQLDMALRRQHELKKEGKHMPIAEILVSMSLVSEKETKAIIYIKDECKKRFIFNANMLGKSKVSESEAENVLQESKHLLAANDVADSSKQIAMLRKENFELKNKLQEIMKIIKR